MSGAEEERKRAVRAEQVALFRYQLIREAADPALSTRQRGRVVREIVSGTQGTHERAVRRAGNGVAVHRRPLSHLPRLPRETSMLYTIGRADRSGRVTNRGITDAVRCSPATGSR